MSVTLHHTETRHLPHMMITFRIGLVVAVVAMTCLPDAASADEWIYRHEHVLGTSCELRVVADSEEAADRAERFALREIDRLSAILSRYDARSELMRWQQGSLRGDQLSEDLVTVLREAERWRQQSAGAFDVRVGALTALWSKAEQQQRLPSDEERRTVFLQFARSGYQVKTDGTVIRHDDLAISLDGLAKGYILDRVCDRLVKQIPEVTGATLNIGGDIRTVGDAAVDVAVTDPLNHYVGADPLTRVVLRGNAAIATSGGYRRGFRIAGRRLSHIIDPRVGLPAGHMLTASVIAPTAIDADAAATALSVLQPSEGISLVESIEGMECLLVAGDGSAYRSSGWPTVEEESGARFVSVRDDRESQSPSGLLVDFTLNRPKGGRYRRPYVAVWLEDKDGFPVKTAVLWLQTDAPGPRWHRDLTRWYRNDRLRKVAERTDLIGTISGATRGPGRYQARFDGTDNAGDPLPPGEYTLCLEVAREHGTYQLIREKVALKGKPIARKALKPNVELSAVSYEYVPPKAANGKADRS